MCSVLKWYGRKWLVKYKSDKRIFVLGDEEISQNPAKICVYEKKVVILQNIFVTRHKNIQQYAVFDFLLNPNSLNM